MAAAFEQMFLNDAKMTTLKEFALTAHFLDL